MPLTLSKRGYSRAPWRLGVLRPDGTFRELPHACFDRKRDAVPVLAALTALALDWDQPDAWTPAQREAVWAIVTETAGYREWQALVQGGPRAPR